MLNLPYTFLWRPRSARIFLYLSKLATQMVISTPLENLSLLLYEPQNKNFNFSTTKTLILHARSIFFRGGHITKIWSKKIFFMKTLSKLGALTVLDTRQNKKYIHRPRGDQDDDPSHGWPKALADYHCSWLCAFNIYMLS